MHTYQAKNEIPCKAKVELSGSMLVKLLASGILHGGDCKCLDANAKKIIWQSLLTSCSQSPLSITTEDNLCA